VRRLEAHVRRGGSVVFCLGPNVDLGAYNDSLFRRGDGLLPARLLSRESAPRGYAYQFILDPDAEKADPLKPFQSAAARERLLAPHFSEFVLAEPASGGRAGITPRKILSFLAIPLPGQAGRAAPRTTGGPAILEWQPPLTPPEGKDRDAPLAPPNPGRGRVVLITTTVNSDWNKWPTSPAFPPLMQELLHFAAASRLREQALNVGDAIELFLPGATGGAQATIELPRDPLEKPEERKTDEELVRKITAETLGEGSVLRWIDTDVRGVYKVVVGRDPREHLFAVNVPAHSEDQQLSESSNLRTNLEELNKTYPEWEVQVVTDPRQVERTASTDGSTPEVVYTPQGGSVARWLLLALLAMVLLEVVLAWLFGHYSATATLPEERPVVKGRGVKGWVLLVAPWVLFGSLLLIGFVLIHDAWTRDFLGFLPDSLRQMIERAFKVPPPAPGEGTRWRLEYSSYFWDAKSDPWLAGTLAVLALGMVLLIYRREGHQVGGRARALMIGLRLGLLLLLLGVLLPQVRLYFERQGWPDVVIIIDDSQSMSTFDHHRDPRVKAAASDLIGDGALPDEEQERLARALAVRPDLTKAERLRLAKALLTRGAGGNGWLTTLLTKRQVRLHVYRCAGRAQRIADVTTPEEIKPALEAIEQLTASSEHDSSQLGAAVRQVLNDFRGSSLAAVVMLTDGVTTEGEDLAKVSKYAAQMGTPLFFVGLGDAQEVRDVYLHDLQMPEVVYVHDRMMISVQLTAQGYDSVEVPVTLYERGTVRKRLKPDALTAEERARLDRKELKVDDEGFVEVDREKKRTKVLSQVVKAGGGNKTVKVRFVHKPKEPGEMVYEIVADAQEGEVDKDNNRVERAVSVRQAKPVKVLYVEGYRRYEYHYIKTLLERESAQVKGNKSIDLKVLLLDADGDFASQDRTAISSFPTKEELKTFDVVILGDVDPEPKDDPKMKEHLKDLADFVRERGGGLLMIAGERYAPRAYKNSPLKNILPIDVGGGEAEDEDVVLTESYRAELTPVGRMHPIFSFSPAGDEKESEEIYRRLKEMFWYAAGYQPKRAAEVLAVHPRLRLGGKKAVGKEGAPDRHPLVVQQFVGAGRCMFFGFHETWRWNWREDQLYFNHFWMQTVRYLARNRLGRVELRLDRQTPYRRGEPIRITVRFPDDAPAPPEKTRVKVLVERRAGRGDSESRTVQLAKLPGSRAIYETVLTRTPEGEYKFWLVQPTVPKPQPRAECKVLAPPSEMERLRMNQAEMEQASADTRGRFYTLADADRLLDELPTGNRVTVNSSGPPWLLWNHLLLFLLALGLLTVEWLLRKQKNLL
jgi:hypothetical protein